MIPALLQKGPVMLDERVSAPTDTLEKMIAEYKRTQGQTQVKPCFDECLEKVDCSYPNCKK